MAIASGVFSVYLVSTDTTWTETLITDVVGTLDGTRLTAELPQSLLGVIELDGEFTLAVKCTITRQGTNYTKKIYLNHLGVYESIFRLRQKVAFLDITKKDE